MMIVEALTVEQIETVRRLFREYEAWMGLNLCFQGFEEELAALPGKYASPDGRLLLAVEDDEAAGCIALRDLGDGICEMKRLFVRDNYRGRGIGNALIGRVIAEARASGYRKMRLDTYPPKMAKAVALYKSYGFVEIEPYYHNPYGDTLFMQLDL